MLGLKRIDFDAQAVVAPVFDIEIENAAVLIVIQPAQQQGRQSDHGAERVGGAVRQGRRIERQMHVAVNQRVMLLIDLGQAAVGDRG